MPHPLLSVIIPTHKRRRFLPRAIDGALEVALDDDVEVIVVPNGPDESWKTIAERYKAKPRVKWHPIETAHANVARNSGKMIANGKYIKFLDDDDCLLEGIAKQIELAEKHNFEICSAPVELRDRGNVLIKRLDLPKAENFTDALLSRERKTGFQYHLYLSSAISDLWLNEGIDVGQDTHWTHDLGRLREWRWGKINEPGCTWRHHDGTQISASLNASEHLKMQEKLLWETISILGLSHRMDKVRESYAASGMWSLIHAGFFMSPQYWHQVIRKVQNRFPGTHPEIPIYSSPVGRFIPPLLLESIMLPKRWINHARRQMLVQKGLKNAWEF